MSKHHRNGGKFAGNHTTLIPRATQLLDEVQKFDSIARISPSIIRSGLRPTHGSDRVRIIDEKGAILLCVRAGVALQEIWVYASDVQEAKLAIARTARNIGLSISFS